MSNEFAKIRVGAVCVLGGGAQAVLALYRKSREISCRDATVKCLEFFKTLLAHFTHRLNIDIFVITLRFMYL